MCIMDDLLSWLEAMEYKMDSNPYFCYSPQIPVDIPLILGNLITIIFDYQILRKPLKTLSL